MVSVFKKSLFKLIVLAVVISMVVGCTNNTNEKETASSGQSTESIQILTGATAVEGEGVSVILTDSESSEGDPNMGLIHDVDLMEVVNILTNAGAEVISINDERLIGVSKIKSNKMMIRINNTEYDSPFIIKAIGNTKELMKALEREDSYIHLLRKSLGVKIEEKEKLFIPKYKENINFEYAKPVKEEK